MEVDDEEQGCVLCVVVTGGAIKDVSEQSVAPSLDVTTYR